MKIIKRDNKNFIRYDLEEAHDTDICKTVNNACRLSYESDQVLVVGKDLLFPGTPAVDFFKSTCGAASKTGPYDNEVANMAFKSWVKGYIKESKWWRP